MNHRTAPPEYLSPEIVSIVEEYAQHGSLETARKALIDATGGPVGEGYAPTHDQLFKRRMGFMSLRANSLARSRLKIIGRS